MDEDTLRFWTHVRDPTLTLGEFLTKYFMMWTLARQGGVPDYEASQRLLGQMPDDWKTWVVIQISDLLTTDYLTYMPIGDFPRLVSRIFMHWVYTQAYPIPTVVIPGPEPRARPDLPEKRVASDSVSYTSPLKRGRHDDEAGPSRVGQQRPRQQVHTFDALLSERSIPERQPQRRVRRTARMSVKPASELPPSFLHLAGRARDEQGPEQKHHMDEDDDWEKGEGFAHAGPADRGKKTDSDGDPVEDSEGGSDT